VQERELGAGLPPFRCSDMRAHAQEQQESASDREQRQRGLVCPTEDIAASWVGAPVLIHHAIADPQPANITLEDLRMGLSALRHLKSAIDGIELRPTKTGSPADPVGPTLQQAEQVWQSGSERAPELLGPA